MNEAMGETAEQDHDNHIQLPKTAFATSEI
jgi:hypothetical protein